MLSPLPLCCFWHSEDSSQCCCCVYILMQCCRCQSLKRLNPIVSVVWEVLAVMFVLMYCFCCCFFSRLGVVCHVPLGSCFALLSLSVFKCHVVSCCQPRVLYQAVFSTPVKMPYHVLPVSLACANYTALTCPGVPVSQALRDLPTPTC